MALLASDDNNPEFAGAHNPDSRLAVHFYSRVEPDNWKSEQEGRPIFYEVDYVKIVVPGNTLSMPDIPVREEHKRKWPLQWAHYQNQRSGDPMETAGTPLSEWPRLNKAQVEELRAKKFYTVEMIAGCSDLGLQSIGMAAGMSPHAFRDHAIRFLSLAKGDAVAKAAEDRAKALEAINAELASKIEEGNKRTQELQEQMAAFLAAQSKVVEPKKRGRPPKAANA